MKNIFLNINEKRLRTGWRILLTLAVTIVIFIPIQFLLKEIVPSDLSKTEKIDILLAVFSIIITTIVLYSRKYIDKRSIKSLGIRDKKSAFKLTMIGFLISFSLVILIVIIEMSFGWLSIEFQVIDWSVMLPKLFFLLFVSGIAVAWWENLFLLSYVFLNLKDGCGFWCAVVLNILIASGLHLSNPNASILSFIGICIIHSYELYAFLKTKSLWMVLGIHAGWNFTQGLLGFSVSGHTDIQVLTQINNTPSIIGGGGFGPEAGLLMLFTGPIAFYLIFLFTKYNNNNSFVNVKDWIAGNEN